MRESSDESPQVWQEWILEAIRKIRSQKQRPSIQRICQAIGSHHKFHEDVVAEKLQQAVETGAVIKVYNKGLHSYKSPTTMGLRKSLSVDKSSDLSRLVTKAVRVLGECDGSAVKSIENFVQRANNLLMADNSDFKQIVKRSLKIAVSKKMLTSDGKLFKLGPNAVQVPRKRQQTNTPSPKKRKSNMLETSLESTMDDLDDDDDLDDEDDVKPKVINTIYNPTCHNTNLFHIYLRWKIV